MDNLTFDEQLQLFESVLFRSIQYSKLVGTKYFDYIDKDKFTEYLYDTYSIEAMWKDISTMHVIGAINDNDNEGKRDGTYGRYNGTNGQSRAKNFSQWVKMESGEIATNGIIKFVKNLDKLSNVISGWMRNLKVKWKLRKVTPEAISTIMKDIKANIARRDEMRGPFGPKVVTVYGPDISLLSKRLQGYLAICDTIHHLAEDSDEEAFDSDKTWDSFAQQSNRAIKAVPPKQGMFFRELVRIEPYVHTFDCTKSEWADQGALDRFVKEICDVKEQLFVKIEDDIKFIKKITDGLRSEVSHIKIKRDDVGGAIADNTIKEKTVGPRTVGRGSSEEMDEVVIQYARGYVASKFVLQLQDMFAAEVGYIMNDLPKIFIPPKDKERDERTRSKAQNKRDVEQIEKENEQEKDNTEENK